jgi:fatty-acid desaturase
MHISNSLFTLILLSITVLSVCLGIDRWWRENSYDLQGKNVLITGGSRGLGLVMARQLI